MENNRNTSSAPGPSPGRADKFNRAIGSLVGIPGVISTKPTTVRATTQMVGDAQTFIIQTFRSRDESATDAEATPSRDTVFIEYIDGEGSVRLVLPPEATRVIARQRDALTTRSRKRGAKAAAADRKARGIVPGFMRGKKKTAAGKS